MLHTIRVNILVPLMGRVGTMAATALAPLGVHADLAHQVGIGVTAVGLIAFDLAVSYLNRKYVAKKAFEKGGERMINGLMGI